MGHISTHDWVSRGQAAYQARSEAERRPASRDESFHTHDPADIREEFLVLKV